MKNIYKQCPTYETESFFLRLVKLDDAEDLLCCYSDRANVKKFNDDFCTSDFYYTTVEEMENCIRFWLEEYQKQYYVRFSVIPKSNMIYRIHFQSKLRPVEFFCKKYMGRNTVAKQVYTCQVFVRNAGQLQILSTSRHMTWKAYK